MVRAIIMALVCVLVFPMDAFAQDYRDVVRDKQGRVVLDLRHNCVYTRWYVRGANPCPVTVVEVPEMPALPWVPPQEPVPYAPIPAPAPQTYVPPAPVEQSLYKESIYFGFDSAKIRPGEAQKLDVVSRELNQAQQIYDVNIAGYADRIGSAAYNLRLSNRRAQAVHDYLKARATAHRYQTEVVSHGETRPIAPCDGIKGRAKLRECLATDRRVDIEVLYQPY